ncbi:MAG: hypothetical protein ACR2GY_14000 [Phycisphaerales bacterium]
MQCIRTGLAFIGGCCAIALAGTWLTVEVAQPGCACSGSSRVTPASLRHDPPGGFDWKNADPETFIRDAFEASGYTKSDAALHARAWMQSKEDLAREEPERTPMFFEWKHSNPVACMIGAFQLAGRPVQEAADLATAYGEEIGLELGGSPLFDDDEPNAENAERGGPHRRLPSDCQAYKVTVIWCSENPTRRHVAEVVMDAACWTYVKACPTSLLCPSPDIIWYSVTVDPACFSEIISPCVWIGSSELQFQTNCDNVTFGCECIEETDASDVPICSEIEQSCANYADGPAGCPSCD